MKIATTLREKMPRTIGEVCEFHAHGRTFQVKRLRANVWHMKDTAINTRSRFGTYAEIAQDIAVALESGKLPPASGPMW